MSMAIISLDTESRSCILTIDGVLIPVDSVHFSKSKYGEDEYVSFGYAIVTKDNNGMTQMIEYILPHKEDDMKEYSMEKNGLASRVVDKTKALIKDISNFLNKS